MKEEMYDYDFEMFKKHNDSVIDESRLASKPATIDIFTEFKELDTFEITDNDLDFEENLISGYQDLIDEVRAKKEETENSDLLTELTEDDDEMNTTMEIDNFHDEILENMDQLQKEKEKKPMTMELAFIYCSIIGFTVMIVGYELFFYFLHKM